MSELRKIKRALISVSDKNGIVEFAKELKKIGVEIISTGGTARTLQENGVEVTKVSDVTGFPEMMNGRVKTLHPKIHGAFLALRDNDEHVSAMNEHNIEPIDLVVINLYPFEETIEKDGVTLEEAVEQIDIGGPAMIRSASKNFRDVAVLTDARLYEDVLNEMKENDGSLSLKTRKRLAALAYTRTSFYDLAISGYLAEQISQDDLEYLEPLNPYGNLAFIEMEEETAESEDEELVALEELEDGEDDSLPSFISVGLAKVADLRYGENPHQKAALYDSGEESGIANAEQLHGKEMSFNNYVDAEAAWRIANDFDELAVAIIKHTNPSGVGLGANLLEAHQRALATDPVSAFGGIVAMNRVADAEVATAINKVFTEVVIAPDFTEDALAVFRKKKNLRILKVDTAAEKNPLEFRQISGGYLIQDQDLLTITAENLKVVSEREPNATEIRAMLLAWKCCKHVKSNAIVFANDVQTVGVGAGQMNRVDSVRIAAMRAKKTELELEGTVLASDAFFPFRDNVDEAAKFGISAIIQPGGSKRDDESIEAANEHGISMVFTGYRHFKH